jgi:hypothetical protein
MRTLLIVFFLLALPFAAQADSQCLDQGPTTPCTLDMSDGTGEIIIPSATATTQAAVDALVCESNLSGSCVSGGWSQIVTGTAGSRQTFSVPPRGTVPNVVLIRAVGRNSSAQEGLATYARATFPTLGLPAAPVVFP